MCFGTIKKHLKEYKFDVVHAAWYCAIRETALTVSAKDAYIMGVVNSNLKYCLILITQEQTPFRQSWSSFEEKEFEQIKKHFQLWGEIYEKHLPDLSEHKPLIFAYDNCGDVLNSLSLYDLEHKSLWE